MTTPLAATKHSLRGLAPRWQLLPVEIREHERRLVALTSAVAVAPAMVAAFGIGADTAAEVLIVAGEQPRRHSS